MNSITNVKLREQALSNNAAGRSCKYVCSWHNVDKTEICKNIRSTQMLLESSLAKMHSWPIAGKQSCHHSRSSGLHNFINTRACYKKSSSHHWYFSLPIVPLATYNGHVSEDTNVAMVKNCTHLTLYPWGSLPLVDTWLLSFSEKLKSQQISILKQAWWICIAPVPWPMALEPYFTRSSL